jgi:hypothetical protein
MTHVSLWQDFFPRLNAEGVGFTGARVTGASPVITREVALRSPRLSAEPAESNGD